MPYQLYHLITLGVKVLYAVEMKKKVKKELLDWQSKGHSLHNSLNGGGYRSKFIQIARIHCFFFRFRIILISLISYYYHRKGQ